MHSWKKNGEIYERKLGDPCREEGITDVPFVNFFGREIYAATKVPFGFI